MTDYNRAFPMAARAANWVAIAAALIALLLLALLHVVSPEFDPSWRMISEYANGKHGWILSLMFAFWGVSQLALLLGIWRQQGKARFTIGLIFLFLSGAGTVMASVFDVNNPLHDLVSYFGILGLPVAAMLITGALGRSPGWSQAKTPLLWSANSTWIAVVLFAASFGVMALTFHSAGIVMDPQAGPTAHAPAGVIGVVGVTDRLTVAVNYLWVAAVAWQAIRLSREETR